jgi:hypothetical protein
MGKEDSQPKQVPDLQQRHHSDGSPFDEIRYLECKIILKPDRFTSVQSFHDFGKLVHDTAKDLKIGFIPDVKTDRRPGIREITFLDTPDFRLYNHAFILRRRISYQDGFPVGDPEIVLKFRHPKMEQAAELDLRPHISGKYRIKFKAEVLPLRDQIGGFRLLYSHNCQFGLSQVPEEERTKLATLARVFPALAVVMKSESEKVSLVNEAIVEELLLDLGQLDFGKEVVAEAEVALWRTRGDHKPLVGEFSYQCKFDKREEFHVKARQRCEQFFVMLQHAVQDWLSLGTTKTGIVYRLNGNAPQSHE